MLKDKTELQEYQDWVKEVMFFDNKDQPDDRMYLTWATIGLNSEAGEVAGEVEKILRNGEGPFDRSDKIFAELGDVLWYTAAVCNALDITLDEVMEYNISKINKRVYEASLAAAL